MPKGEGVDSYEKKKFAKERASFKNVLGYFNPKPRLTIDSNSSSMIPGLHISKLCENMEENTDFYILSWCAE